MEIDGKSMEIDGKSMEIMESPLENPLEIDGKSGLKNIQQNHGEMNG
jgi:hypothetical protein